MISELGHAGHMIVVSLPVYDKEQDFEMAHMETSSPAGESEPIEPARRLILMRHAKSDWGDNSLSDHDRPLNYRGARDAPAMARWMCESGFHPDLVLCSSAQRARETVDLGLPEWDTTPEIAHSDSLYLATPEIILSVLQSESLGSRTVLVVGHNPGMSHLSSILSGQAIEMPTAAVSIFQCGGSQWPEIRSPDQVALIQLMKPKALPQ